MSEKNPFHGATFAERKALRGGGPQTKAVEADEADDVENKAVAPKKTARKTTRKG